MQSYDQQNNNTTRNLTYLLIGGGLGAVAALLFAPKSGSEFRSDLAETARTGYDGAIGLATRVKDESSGLYQTVCDKKDDLLNLAGWAATETKDRVGDAIEAGRDRANEVRAALPDGEAAQPSDESAVGQSRSGNTGRRSSSVI